MIILVLLCCGRQRRSLGWATSMLRKQRTKHGHASATSVHWHSTLCTLLQVCLRLPGVSAVFIFQRIMFLTGSLFITSKEAQGSCISVHFSQIISRKEIQRNQQIICAETSHVFCGAGDALCELLQAAGQDDLADQMVKEIAVSVPAATWAVRRLAHLQIASGQPDKVSGWHLNVHEIEVHASKRMLGVRSGRSV